MMYDLYYFLHDSWGMCFWLLPSILVAGIMVIMGVVHTHNYRKREREYEKAREEMRKEEA